MDDAPQGPFGGATCLLTLHFLKSEERLKVLQQTRQRLKPADPLIVAHHSYPTGDSPQPWVARSIAFADRTSNDRVKAAVSAETINLHLPILSSDEDEALLGRAGFSNIALFYAAFSFRGWVATA